MQTEHRPERPRAQDRTRTRWRQRLARWLERCSWQPPGQAATLSPEDSTNGALARLRRPSRLSPSLTTARGFDCGRPAETRAVDAELLDLVVHDPLRHLQELRRHRLVAVRGLERVDDHFALEALHGPRQR